MRLSLIALATLMSVSEAATAQEVRSAKTEVLFDTMLYHDSDHVDVISPEVAASRKLDDDGGVISATVVVDIVTAASVDVISEATPGFTEVREEVDLRGSKRLGPWLPGAHYRFSDEPDYLSHGGGLSLERRVGFDTTLNAGLDVTYDQIGRHGTSFADYERTLWTTAAELGMTQVLDPRTLLRLVYTFTLQDGYLAKPYRYVPLFDATSLAAAQAAGVTLGLDTFDRYRLPERPPENVPDLRLRHALGARLLRFLPGIDGAFRLDYRLYLDDWGMWGHTVEAGLRLQLGGHLRGEVSSRTNYQTSVWFWQKVYQVSGAGVAPQFLTVDKDLSESLAETGTARLEWVHGALALHGDLAVTYQRFFDYLFLDSRTAVVLLLGLRWEP